MKRMALAATIATALFSVLLMASTVEPVGAAGPADSTGTGVTVRTVPAIGGVGVSLDGQVKRTDEFGVALFVDAERRDAGTRVEVLEEIIEVDGTRWTLERRYGDGPDVALTFSTERRVGFTFRTVGGTPVPPERIQELSLKSSVGDVIDVTEDVGAPMWLRSARVVSSSRGPEESLIQWSVISVLVDGSNVVNRAEVRFEPSSTTSIEVGLLFFTARVHVTDAFFGFAQQGDLVISHPDGSTSTVPIPGGGEVVLDDLPRGDYDLVVEGPGVRLTRPLALSRDQDVDLELLSWLDLGAVAAIGIMFAAFPLAVGFRRRRHGRTELEVRERPTRSGVATDGAS